MALVRFDSRYSDNRREYEAMLELLGRNRRAGADRHAGTATWKEIAMSRIKEAEPALCEDRVRHYLDAQAKQWGAPLTPSLILARNPALFRAVGSMWSALGSSGVVNPALAALLNRRVAALNGCVF